MSDRRDFVDYSVLGSLKIILLNGTQWNLAQKVSNENLRSVLLINSHMLSKIVIHLKYSIHIHTVYRVEKQKSPP